MYQILPFVAAANLALPELPVELWSIILRFLDPASLLTGVRSSALWSNVSRNDPVLRRTVQRQLIEERHRHQEEILNPGLLISVSREGPTKLFGSNGTKIIRRRPATVVQHAPVEFLPSVKRRRNGGGGPIRKRRNLQQNDPCRIIRC